MTNEFVSKTTENIEEDFPYDGLYFSFLRSDDEEDEEQEINTVTYFKIASEKALSNVPKHKHTLGHTFLLAFLHFDENGIPVFDESFEAILADPEVYIENLKGSGLFGCIVRKTPRAEVWFQKHYIDNAHEVIANVKKDKETKH
jgi:hypothetical protein